jgi:hypothetical protein
MLVCGPSHRASPPVRFRYDVCGQVRSGVVTLKPQMDPPTVPMDYTWAKQLGLVRKPAEFVTSISDERGEELLYAGMPISKTFEVRRDMSSGDSGCRVWVLVRLLQRGGGWEGLAYGVMVGVMVFEVDGDDGAGGWGLGLGDWGLGAGVWGLGNGCVCLKICVCVWWGGGGGGKEGCHHKGTCLAADHLAV